MTRVIAFDGHDACGKTALGQAVAQRLGAPYCKTFPADVGAHLVRLWRQGRIHDLSDAAASAISEFGEAHSRDDLVVCDRHVLSLLALLPDEEHASWELPEVTIVCRADLADVVAREAARGTVLEPSDLPEQRHLLDRYRVLAERHHLWVADSSTCRFDELTERVLEYLADATDGVRTSGRQK